MSPALVGLVASLPPASTAFDDTTNSLFSEAPEGSQKRRLGFTQKTARRPLENLHTFSRRGGAEGAGLEGAGPRRSLELHGRLTWVWLRCTALYFVSPHRVFSIIAVHSSFCGRSSFLVLISLVLQSACALWTLGLRLGQKCRGVPGAGGREHCPAGRPLTGSRCFPLQVVLLGMDILSALVTRLQDRFKAQIGTGELRHLWSGPGPFRPPAFPRSPGFST